MPLKLGAGIFTEMFHRSERKKKKKLAYLFSSSEQKLSKRGVSELYLKFSFQILLRFFGEK